MDRFMLKLVVDYPSKTEERAILERMAFTDPPLDIDAVMMRDHVREARKPVARIYIAEKIKDYVVDLTIATREPAAIGPPNDDWIVHGASPRATLAMTVAAKSSAFLAGRGYVTPQDVKDVAMGVLRHRTIVSHEAEAEERIPEDIIRTVLDHVSVP